MLTLARKPFHRLTWGIAAGLVALMLTEGWLQHRATGELVGNALNAMRAACGMIAVWVIVMHLNVQRRLQRQLEGNAPETRGSALRLSERHFHIMTWCLVLGTLALPAIDGAVSAADAARVGMGVVEAAFMCVGMVIMWGMVLVLDLGKADRA